MKPTEQATHQSMATSVLDADHVGPVDLAVLVFESPAIAEQIGHDITDLVHTGVVRVIDLAVVTAEADSSDGVDDISDQLHGPAFDELADSRVDLLTDEDLVIVKQALPPGSAAMVIVWENTWAATLGATIRRDGGRLAVFERLPHDEVWRAIAARREEGAS